MIKKFWLVWNENGRNPRHKHDNELSARVEAERLTRAHGGQFHVLEAVGTCEKTDIQWYTPANPPQPRGNSPELSDLVNRDDYDDTDPFADE